MKPTRHEYRGYVFLIRYEAGDPCYSVEFPDFAEIVTSGEDLKDAFANACEALDLHLESLRKLGKPVPKPKHHIVVETA